MKDSTVRLLGNNQALENNRWGANAGLQYGYWTTDQPGLSEDINQVIGKTRITRFLATVGLPGIDNRVIGKVKQLADIEGAETSRLPSEVTIVARSLVRWLRNELTEEDDRS
ncbi:unnamed protein product [Vicia faba]|uniref:Uncharacterized protein n=1 Tax=Vicia faba TaxID=3906 RepID=A0AAV1AG23_VICFA|nr:unnamed protein product [Vicia faba]